VGNDTDPQLVRERVLADYHAQTTRRSRRATVALVRAGYHVGSAPLGYRLTRVPRVGADATRTRTRLTPDPYTADAIAWIFSWRVLADLGDAAIARRLHADGHRRWANAHTGRLRPWAVNSVRAVLATPIYTGRQVWARTVAGRPVPPQDWILSGPGAHPALVTDQVFLAAQPASLRPVLAARLGVPHPPDPTLSDHTVGGVLCVDLDDVTGSAA
jgi:GAF domain-containing protein